MVKAVKSEPQTDVAWKSGGVPCQEQVLEFYARQSGITDPGRYE
jgi:hypothetical protein